MSTGPAGAPVQKQDPDSTSPFTGTTDQFRTQITDFINSLPKDFSDTYNLFGYTQPYVGYLAGTDYGGVAPLLPSGNLANGPVAGDIAGANVSAAVLVSAFQNFASILSGARLYQVNKTYLSIFGNSSFNYGPNLGSMTSPYWGSPGSFSVSLSANTDINAASIDAVVNSVDAQITGIRNTTLQFNETWCHTSCHSSHSSRGRR